MKRTIIITGGTTGIGKATAYQFAKNGWNVVITSRIEKKGGPRGIVRGGQMPLPNQRQ